MFVKTSYKHAAKEEISNSVTNKVENEDTDLPVKKKGQKLAEFNHANSVDTQFSGEAYHCAQQVP